MRNLQVLCLLGLDEFLGDFIKLLVGVVDFLLQVHDRVVLLLALAQQLLLAFQALELPNPIGLLNFLPLQVELSIQALQFDIEVFLESLPLARERLLLLEHLIALLLRLLEL